jgi:hypothetical protein
MTGEVFRMVVDLVDREVSSIVDLSLVRQDHHGTVTALGQGSRPSPS